MTSLMVALLINAGGFQQLSADGGLPEVTLIPSDSPTAAMLITFGTGYGDDLGVTGLSSQVQTALTQANAAFPLRSWNEQAFAGDAHLAFSQGRYQMHFLFEAPRAVFPAMAQTLLKALLTPKLDPAAFASLSGRASPVGVLESDGEFLIELLEPLVLEGALPHTRVQARWVEFGRARAYLDEFVTPGNATITVIGGFEPSAVLPALTRTRRGTRRLTQRAVTRNDVNRKVPAPQFVHLIGYPLPELNPTQTAAMRIIDAMLYDRLTLALRERGLAYTIDVEPHLSPWFNGLLLTVPAFDVNGADLEPFLAEHISKVVHEKLSEQTLERFREGLQLEDELARKQPGSFVQRLSMGAASGAWLGPESTRALAELTPDDVSRVSKELFVSERRRFYVKFGPFSRRAP